LSHKAPVTLKRRGTDALPWLDCVVQLLQAIDGVEIVVVCNRSEESSQRVATKFNIPRIASKWCATPECMLVHRPSDR
jgi:predicted dehydrogenase